MQLGCAEVRVDTWSFSCSGNCLRPEGPYAEEAFIYPYLSLKGIDTSFNSNFDKVLWHYR